MWISKSITLAHFPPRHERRIQNTEKKPLECRQPFLNQKFRMQNGKFFQTPIDSSTSSTSHPHRNHPASKELYLAVTSGVFDIRPDGKHETEKLCLSHLSGDGRETMGWKWKWVFFSTDFQLDSVFHCHQSSLGKVAWLCVCCQLTVDKQLNAKRIEKCCWKVMKDTCEPWEDVLFKW